MSRTNFDSNSRIAVLVLVLALAFAIGLLGNSYNLLSLGQGPSGNFTSPGVIVGATPFFNVPITGKSPGAENAFLINCDGGGTSSGSLVGGNLSSTVQVPVPTSLLQNGGLWSVNCHVTTGFFGGLDNDPTNLRFLYQTFGQPQAGLQGGVVGHPVSTGTGELYEQLEPDLSLGGPLPLEFRRYYGSLTLGNGNTTRLGNNWMHNFEWVLTLNGSAATVNFFEDKAITFVPSGTGFALASATRFGYQLAKSTNGGYQFLDPRTNLIYTFSGTGSTLGLSQIQDRNGNTLQVAPPSSISTSGSVTDGLGRSIVFNYDSTGKLTGIHDQANRTVSFAYTGSDLTRVTDANGKSETYTYTASGGLVGLMTTHALPLGNKPFSQTFDKFGRVATQADSRSNTTSITYGPSAGTASYSDPLGALTTDVNQNYSLFTSLTDANNQTLSVTYDGNGRRTSVTDRLGGKITKTYHSPSGYVAAVTDALGNTTSYTYTAQVQGSFTFYNLTTTQFADGTSESISYDGSGNATAVTDRAGKTSKYAYNSRGQVTSAADASGRTTTYAYNASDATLASTTDPAGNVTSFSYDNVKRVSQIKFADGSTRAFLYDNRDNILRTTDERFKPTTLAYNDNNRLQTATDALNKSASTAYDGDERVNKQTDRTGAATSIVYNQNGQTKSVTAPAGEVFSFIYDPLHRLATAVDPSGNGFTYAYDKEGGLTASTDALNHKTAFTHDAMGRTTQTTTPLGENYKFGYDKLSHLTSITDPTSRSASFGYDARSLLAGVTIGDAPASYTRDDSGLLTAAADPIGGSWNFSYDNAGRLATRTDPLKRATSLSYDKRNRVAGFQNTVGTGTFTYDGFGNITRRQYSDPTDLAYTYDDDERLLTGPGVTLAYDGEGRITTSNALTIARDTDGRIGSVTYGQGKTVTYSYNSNGLLASVVDWVGGSTTFSYDAAHHLTAVKRPNGSGTQYTYDADGRVTSIKEDAGSSLTIQRDAAGRVISENRTQPTPLNPAPGLLPLAYDAGHQVSFYNYDDMGRLTSDTLRSYSWDMASRLTSYSGADGSMTATYDGLGQRISAAQSSGNLNFVWNYATPLASLATVADASGDRRYYVYAPDGTLLYGIDAAGNARHFYHFDETGSTVLLTDDTGAVTDSYAIGAYGESVVHTGSTDNPFTWQGQFGVMQEASTGLYYMRARYYDSTSARFISPDPIASLNPLAMSPYQYAFADPVGNSDPSGLDPNLATIIVRATDTPLLPGPLVSVGPLWPSQDNFSGIVGKHTLKFGFDPRQFQVDNPFFTTVPLLGAPQFGDDATVAARLRAAGAVILGKTNLSEWANFRSSPQGSFSGIPVFPAIPLPGSRGRTVADAAAVLSALVGVDPRDPATAVTARFSTDYTQFLNPATTPIVTFYPKPGQLLAPFVTPGSPSNVVGRPTASAYYSYFSYYAAYYAYYGSSDYWGDWYYGH